jgi:hypothetical protein
MPLIKQASNGSCCNTSIVNRSSSRIIQQSQGAQTEFLTYANSTYGIRMLYPPNWLRLDDVYNIGEVNFPVTFLPDDKNSSVGEDEFVVNVGTYHFSDNQSKYT